MKIRNLYLLFLVIVLTFFSAGYVKSSDEGQKPVETVPLVFDNLPEFRITKGEVLYSRYCIFCHGEAGEGDGLNAFSIPVKPFSLSNRELMTQKSNDELEKVIIFGGSSQGLSKYMPSFGNTFTAFQVKHLLEFIRKQLPEKVTDK